jgi:EAL domain-containing protein (putative c-di-GMP-specific phosphodiesterase class I)
MPAVTRTAQGTPFPTARFVPPASVPRAGSPAETRRLRQDLRQAAEAGGFTLLFQPRRALAGGAVLGAEATLRWPRSRGGAISAGALMTHLESFDLAGPVVARALREACCAASLWASGLLSITVPGASLVDSTLLGHIGAALAESGLSPERLEIALAEPALATESTEALLILAALRDLGVGVAMDGFGAESASLLTLKRLPLTVLKLDRSLVRDLPDDREAQAVVAAAIFFAHALDVSVVACGMETEAQRGFLRRIGCDAAQGSLCGRAVAEAPE